MVRTSERRAIVACPECLGDGGAETRPWGYDPRDGSPRTNWITCAACHGEREEEVLLVPVDCADLDDAGDLWHEAEATS